MFNFSNRVIATRFWGTILLSIGGLTLAGETWSFMMTGKWKWVSFLDAIKNGARETMHITSGEWVYQPHSFIWLHNYMEWLPFSLTLLALGTLGYFAPSLRKKVAESAAEFSKLVVR